MATTTAIDPKASLRGQQITPDKVNTQVTPQVAGFTPVSAIDPVAAQKVAGMAGAGPVSYDAAQGERASGGNRLGINIGTNSVQDQAMRTFQSQLPQMNIDFADQSDQLAKRTASMGRTGSGLFNRDTGYISDRSRAAREGMLGNLSFTAAQTDAANRLQASIESGRLAEQQEGRFANTNVANMQSLNNLAGLNAGNALRAAQGNQEMAGQIGMADAANALKASLANQGTALDLGKFNAGTAADVGMFNAQNDMTGQIQSIQNAMRQNEYGSNFMANERGYQDNLAQQAQQDLWRQMEAFRQGFSGDPTSTMINAGGGIGSIGQQYGANAGQINAGLGEGANQLMQMLMMGGYGGQQQSGLRTRPQNWEGPMPQISQQPTTIGMPRPNPGLVGWNGFDNQMDPRLMGVAGQGA